MKSKVSSEEQTGELDHTKSKQGRQGRRRDPQHQDFESPSCKRL